jgi:hypothetical protein
MRKPPVALLIVMLGCLGASSAPTQDCCHRSIAPTHPTISANPMPSFNMDDVRNEFNASSNKVRVIALLSPTCSDCQSGHAGVGRMLERDPSRPKEDRWALKFLPLLLLLGCQGTTARS